MEITWEVKGEDLFLGIDGKLDTMSAMDLDDRLNDIPDEVKNIYFDLHGLVYIASAGLRVLYWAQDYTEQKGGIAVLRNVSPEVMEILKITGFKDFIKIE
ncbi:STAS domain-containing protein [Oribacterium sp. P6A1]|uniref:STAS domain-containing protein n=1 Tax=Oribacterium sp. P6A1 TaxID=1410612 RepID=UPI0005622794|nr:STAS domain-containing protein [Oribacterium sp. P6A1]